MQDDSAGQGKANFDHIYNRPDPREYFQVLAELDYQIPQLAQPVFAALLAAREHHARHEDGRTVLDVCCSYGVNAALLRCDVSMADLVRHYREPSLANMSPAELVAADRSFYAEHRHANAPRIAGLDVATNAVEYGRRVGLLDNGGVENLERQPPSAQLIEALGDVGLIISTGGVGYITARTFDGLLRVIPSRRRPWVAVFVLRMFSYARIAETLERHDLVTEELPETTFPQRRFASTHEQDITLAAVRARSLDPTGREEQGRFHACFYLSRPASDVAAMPLTELVSGLTFTAGAAHGRGS